MTSSRCSCPGNGDGWHQCYFTVWIRIPGATRSEAAQAVAETYRSRGFALVAEDGPWAPGDTIYWEPRCLEQDGREELLCVSIEEPRTDRFFEVGEEELARPLQGDEVDLVTTSWTYFV